MAERDLLVRILGDDKDYQRALARSSKGTQTFDAKIGRSTGGLLRWGKAAAVAGAGIAAATGVVAIKAVGAASDLNEEVNKSSVLFGKSSGAVIAWSKTTASNLGLSQRAALEATGNFGAMFSTIGIGDKVAAGMSTRLVRLGSDLASFSNQDPEDMLLRLRSGLAGEAEPLRRFGILLSEQRVKQEAVRLGLVKSGQELTEQQKVAARYSLILHDAGKANGDFARTSEGFANAQRIAKAELENTAASLGSILLPVVARGLTAFNKFLPAITKGVGDIAAKVGPGISAFVNAFTSKLPELERIARSLIAPFMTYVVPVLRDLAGIVSQTWTAIVDVFAANEGQIRIILSNLGQALRSVWSLAKPTIVFLFTKVLPTALKIAIPIIARVSTAAKTMAGVWVAIVRIIVQAIDKFLGALGFLASAASHLPLIGDKFKGVDDKIKTARASLQSFVGDLDKANGKKVDVTVNVNTTKDGKGKPRKTQSSTTTADPSAGVDAATVAAGVTGGSLDANAKATKNVETKAEKARRLFDALMAKLSLAFDKAEVRHAYRSQLEILTEEENAVKKQIAIEGRTAELERQLFDIAQQRIALRAEHRKGQQFLALGLTATGEARTPSAKALLRRVGSLEDQIKGTPLDTKATRAKLARIAKVLRGAFGAVGKDVRDAILGMLNDISSALKGDGTKTGGSRGTGEITRGGIVSTAQLIEGLGLTPEQIAIITRRNMRITRRQGRIGAFGYAIGRGTSPERDRGWEGTRGSVPAARDAYVFNGPVTVVANDPESFMRSLQKKSSRTAGSRRGRHGGVRLGLG